MSCKESVNLFTKKQKMCNIIISSGTKWSKVGGLLSLQETLPYTRVSKEDIYPLSNFETITCKLSLLPFIKNDVRRFAGIFYQVLPLAIKRFNKKIVISSLLLNSLLRKSVWKVKVDKNFISEKQNELETILLQLKLEEGLFKNERNT